MAEQIPAALRAPRITTDEPCPSGHADCTVDCGSCKGTGKRIIGRQTPATVACPACTVDPMWGHDRDCPTWLAECARRSAEEAQAATDAPLGDEGWADYVARRFHTEYEQIAPQFGYRTRVDSAVPWEQVPEANKRLMRSTIAALIQTGVIELGPAWETQGESDV